MTKQLEPCPFCGGEVVHETGRHNGEPCGDGLYVCNNLECLAAVKFPQDWSLTYNRNKESERRWNTRYRPTCRDTAGGAHDFICSECGAELELAPMKPIGKHGTHEYVKVEFCPSCGAEVLDD